MHTPAALHDTALAVLPKTEETFHSLLTGLDTFSIAVASMIGYVGVLVITAGVIRAATLFVRATLHKHDYLSHVRIELGKYLALGLEFFIGKDIIESVVHPTWEDLGKLGAIIALRTVITIFLSRELQEAEEEMELEILDQEKEFARAK